MLGSTLSLDGVPFTVLGVLPVGFQFRVPGQESGPSTPDVWIPVGANGAGLDDEGHHAYPGIARLAGATPLAAAFTQTEGILRGEREPTMRSARITPRATEERSAAREPLLLLLGAVSLLMVVGCANVAALMLGEVAVRRQEFATRAALGADGLRLVRQLLVESVILGVVGAAAGLAVAHTGVRALVRYAPATKGQFRPLASNV